MAYRGVRFSAAILIGLCLAACVTRQDHVLAPAAEGLVIDTATGQPIAGAEVRYVELGSATPIMTDAEGAFTLEGRTERRTRVVLPVSGVYRDSAMVQASAPGLADGYATAGFINGLGPEAALYPVIVLMFPADAPETPLHALMQDCVEGPRQHHALQMVAYVAGLDAADPPPWLNPDTAEGLDEHLGRVLPSSGFQKCARMSEAWALYKSQTAVLWTVRTARQASETR
ncbi:MAG: carboxypeptidase-like regulatory domain-containing protein [Brevundimonas sp.]|uniref:carboxypeptidase-like regulatory domain-containing protein n=1 Tax=Brevundimonas sp. TaxID=1871086 RepID=UPI00273509C6|nr:carboxypeptidase-like regulatory domain-containing protein [Brevundimonas sp.]MDP3378534.1 carboxypeptidase-like regulatory domain-containing protein [Brevundimonas sp.]